MKKNLIANIITLIAIRFLVYVLGTVSIAPLSLFGVMVDISAVLGYLLGLLFNFALIHAMYKNKSLLSKPLFDENEKIFRRYYINKLLILEAFEFVYYFAVSLLMFLPFRYVTMAISDLLLYVLWYVIITKGSRNMIKQRKFFLPTIIISVAIVATNRFAEYVIYSTSYGVLDGSTNIFSYLQILSAGEFLSKLSVISSTAVWIVFLISHSLSVKTEE
ncbi:MAG: hypothetical protein IJX54_00255 [Oscillospiraceae bacterium]|nr:hypothetical protein [Oscillospiraceae bacterium]